MTIVDVNEKEILLRLATVEGELVEDDTSNENEEALHDPLLDQQVNHSVRHRAGGHHLHQHVAEQTHRQLKRLTGQFKTKYDKDLFISSKHICDISINIYVLKMNKLFRQRKDLFSSYSQTCLCSNILVREEYRPVFTSPLTFSMHLNTTYS